MLDTDALKQLVESQIEQEVTTQVQSLVNDPAWKQQFEEKIVQHIQDRITGKFANSSALPEIIDAVKTSVRELFEHGHLPGIGGFVDPRLVKQNVDLAVEELVTTAINELTVDPVWLTKIETLVNQTMIQRVLMNLASVDIKSLVTKRIDENIEVVNKQLFPGIEDRSTNTELTLFDKNVVVENTLTAKNIETVDALTVKNLVVTSSINTDNESWIALSDGIVKRTHDSLTEEWKDTLTQQVGKRIAEQGIDFKHVMINGKYVINGNELADTVTESSLKTVGNLTSLTVVGDAHLNETLKVVQKRVGINTTEPEMALTIWDEETSLVAGKHKDKTAFVGTARRQALAIGVNKQASIEIAEDELTTIKKLQVGVNKFSHGIEVPNYSGVKGDIVFNANANVNSPIFAWICLGGFRWKVLKAMD